MDEYFAKPASKPEEEGQASTPNPRMHTAVTTATYSLLALAGIMSFVLPKSLGESEDVKNASSPLQAPSTNVAEHGVLSIPTAGKAATSSDR